MKKRLLCLLLSLVMLVCLVPFAASAGDPEPENAAAIKKVYDETGDYLLNLCKTNTPIVGSTGGEWAIIDLARAGIGEQEIYDGWYQNVINEVNNKINNDKERFHSSKSTENSRIILALVAAGFDPTNVNGHDLTWGLTDYNYIKKQGINGPIWALIALDSHGYEFQTNASAAVQATRENVIEFILGKQLSSGGWALSGTNPDPDMTGMAVQSLAPYYNKMESVKSAVDKAIECMSSMQREDGGYASWGSVNSESCAQIIVALTALGIDPNTDPRFVKEGKSVVDALIGFAVEGGGFKHILSGSVNGMATEQAFYALSAYYRLKNEQTSLYDMSDVHIYEADHNFEYEYNETEHWLSCECGESQERETHVFGEWDETERVCEVCGFVESRPVSNDKTVVEDKTPLATQPATLTPANTSNNSELIANTSDSNAIAFTAVVTLVSVLGAAYLSSVNKERD